MDTLEKAKEEIKKWYSAAINSNRGPVGINIDFSKKVNSGEIRIVLNDLGAIYRANFDNYQISELIPFLSDLFVKDESIETILEENGSYILNCKSNNNIFSIERAEKGFVNYCKEEINKRVNQYKRESDMQDILRNREILLNGKTESTEVPTVTIQDVIPQPVSIAQETSIEGRLENNYADLINNRRDALRPELKFGRRVVVDKKVTHRHEEVSRDEAVSEFGEEAVEKAEEEARAKVDEERAQQEEKIEEAKEELMEGVQAGKTQEELEQVASEAGITLDPHYQENMEAALAEQAQGEEKAHEIEESVASHNQEAEAQAAAREQAEAQKQQEESSMLDSLIAQSAEADAKEETEKNQEKEERLMILERAIIEMAKEKYDEEKPRMSVKEELIALREKIKEEAKAETLAVDQTDSGRKESDENPYTPESSDTSSVAEELEALKAVALQLDVDGLELLETKMKL